MYETYNRLDDRDLLSGLKRMIVSDPKLKKGLSLVQHRQWVKACKFFASYIENADLESDNVYDILNKKVAEENWIHIHKELNDWNGLKTINDKHNNEKVINQDLHLEMAWRTKELKALEIYINFVSGTGNLTADSFLIQVELYNKFI